MIQLGMFLGLLWGLWILLSFTAKGAHSFDLPQWALIAIVVVIAWVCLSAVVRWFRR